MLRLMAPDESHRDEVMAMRAEWEGIRSPSRLFFGESYDEFLQVVSGDPVRVGEGLVPANLYLLVDDISGRVLGALQLRHHIDHPRLRDAGGHIGYGVRTSERGRGYATEMLRLGLEHARELGLDRVLVSCLDTNIASAKVIETNGGVYERMTEQDGEPLRLYWITL